MQAAALIKARDTTPAEQESRYIFQAFRCKNATRRKRKIRRFTDFQQSPAPILARRIWRTGRRLIEKRKASSACAQRTGARNVAATKSAFATFHFSERGSVRTDLSRHRNGRPPYRTPRRIAMQNSRN